MNSGQAIVSPMMASLSADHSIAAAQNMAEREEDEHPKLSLEDNTNIRSRGSSVASHNSSFNSQDASVNGL